MFIWFSTLSESNLEINPFIIQKSCVNFPPPRALGRAHDGIISLQLVFKIFKVLKDISIKRNGHTLLDKRQAVSYEIIIIWLLGEATRAFLSGIKQKLQPFENKVWMIPI